MPELVGEVIEQYQYRGVSSSSGIATRTRGFRVVGMNVDQALNTTGVPVYKSAHPDYADMWAKDFSTTWQGCDTHVVVTYVPKEFIGVGIPPVDEFGEEFVGVDQTFDDVDVDIPLYQQTTIKVGNPPDVVSQLVWQRRTDVMKYQYSRNIIRIDIALELDTESNFDVAMSIGVPIRAQINKIHTLPDGKDYLFKPEGLDQSGPKQFKATYRWYSDPGVPNVLAAEFGGVFAGENLQLLGGTGYPVFDEDFLIPPFNGVRIDGDAEDPTNAPKVTFFERFDTSDPQGWRSLPGV